MPKPRTITFQIDDETTKSLEQLEAAVTPGIPRVRSAVIRKAINEAAERLSKITKFVAAPVDNDGHVTGFGVVAVRQGTHANKIGYYDDDVGNKALVYLGDPCNSEDIVVKKNTLGEPTAIEIEQYNRNVEKQRSRRRA